MTQFTRDTLEAIREVCTSTVEVMDHDADGCTIAVGTRCTIEAVEATNVVMVRVEDMGYACSFHDIGYAALAAEAIEEGFNKAREYAIASANHAAKMQDVDAMVERITAWVVA